MSIRIDSRKHKNEIDFSLFLFEKVIIPNYIGNMINDEINDSNLSKFLSGAGVASRRKSAELVKAGLVRVNGELISNPGYRVGPADVVTVDGRQIRLLTTKYYVMLNKPRGYVCTNDDPHATKKAIDLIRIPGDPRLFSAGRLDKDSEGLLLFSNDGDFVDRLTHPRNQVQKVYEVSLARPLTPLDCKRFLDGIKDQQDLLRAISIFPIGPTKYTLILGEGKNREIRRMVAAVGNETKRLRRVAVGRLRLGSLEPGKWRPLSEQEIALPFLLPEKPVSSGQTPPEMSQAEARDRNQWGTRAPRRSSARRPSQAHGRSESETD